MITKRITKKEFILKAKKVHRNKYSYEKQEWFNLLKVVKPNRPVTNF